MKKHTNTQEHEGQHMKINGNIWKPMRNTRTLMKTMEKPHDTMDKQMRATRNQLTQMNSIEIYKKQ